MHLRLSALLAVCLAAATAAADPVQLAHAGKLFDGTDAPVTNPALALKFAIYDTAVPINTETRLWQGSYTVSVTNGFYAVVLGTGAGNALDGAVLNGDSARYLQASIDGVPMLPRMLLVATPHANWSDTLEGKHLADVVQKSELAASHYTRTEIDALLAPLATTAALTDLETQLRADLLTQASAAATYLSRTDAAGTYLAKTDATAAYLAKTDAATTYLAKPDAVATYLSKADATSTYLKQADATSTYLTKTAATAGFVAQAGGDATITRDAKIGRDALVTGAVTSATLTVAGLTTLNGNVAGINNTLSFKGDPGGGSGDVATISYKAYGTTPATIEDTELLIDVGNDPTDRLRLHATGGIQIDASGQAGPTLKTPCQTGYTAINGGRLCVQTAMPAASDFYTAAANCRAAPGSGLSAHVCTYSDMQTACGNGFDSYAGKPFGWYGDLGTADDVFQTWNGPTCGSTNNTGTPTSSATSYPYRCCY